MHKENYSLKWHAYSDHLRRIMKELMIDEDFSDVTLITEDKKQIKANINILSACSPIFKDILKKEKNTNTIMYLRGVQYSEMESIIHFIYLGEATLSEQRIDEFLALAKSLEIKELAEALDINKLESNNELDDGPSSFKPKTVKPEEEKVLFDDFPKQAAQQRRGVVDKIECNQCHRIFSGSGALSNHKKSVHKGVEYACDHCDFICKGHGSLARHIQSIHEGFKYACDQCDYEATSRSNLTLHIQSKHEGMNKYACNQCDFKASHRETSPTTRSWELLSLQSVQV